MDDARALLDSLMGNTRNAGKEERKKNKNQCGFTKESVCKFYLVGFCPENESLFHNTRRDLGACPRTHFEISKEEFNAHPEKAKYEAQYERELLNHLKDIIRRCDDWAAKERQKNEYSLQKALEEGGNEVAKQEIGKLHDEASKLIAEAEELASAGNVNASRAKLDLSDQYKKKAEEWKEKQKALVPEVCEICGLTKENDAGVEKGKVFAHSMGKVHKGFLLIRKMYAEIREKQAKRDADRQAGLTERGDDEQAGAESKREREISFRFEGESDRRGDRREDREDRRGDRRDFDRRDRDDRGAAGRRRDDGDRKRRRDDDDYRSRSRNRRR